MPLNPPKILVFFSRATLDVNREILEAAQGCANAETAYNNYHNKIKSIYSTFTQGKALLIDIHGQVPKCFNSCFCRSIFVFSSYTIKGVTGRVGSIAFLVH